MTTTEATVTIANRALDALTAIEAASIFGLPAPRSFTAGEHRQYPVDLLLRSPAEVGAWADHLGETVRVRVVASGNTHHTVTGTLVGVLVEATAVVPA